MTSHERNFCANNRRPTIIQLTTEMKPSGWASEHCLQRPVIKQVRLASAVMRRECYSWNDFPLQLQLVVVLRTSVSVGAPSRKRTSTVGKVASVGTTFSFYSRDDHGTDEPNRFASHSRPSADFDCSSLRYSSPPNIWRDKRNVR